MDDRSLMELPGDAEELFEFLLAEVFEHACVDHVGGEVLGVLCEPQVRKPFGRDPRMAELGYAGVSDEGWMTMLFDCKA